MNIEAEHIGWNGCQSGFERFIKTTSVFTFTILIKEILVYLIKIYFGLTEYLTAFDYCAGSDAREFK